MPRTQIEIDIPDGYELACDHMRHPKAGDWFLDSTDLSVVQSPCDRVGLRVIVRPAWQWPAWLKCDWVAQNKDGRIAIGTGQPEILERIWGAVPDGEVDYVDAKCIAINLPPCTDWRQSLRLNPNREAKP